MPSIGHDTKYLQELVGDALARGCASTIAAQPNDPVDFLGQWLNRYVKNAQIEGKFYEEKGKELEAKKRQLEAEQEAAQRLHHETARRKNAIKKLAELDDEPKALIKHAIELIKKHTSAGAAYAAAVAEPEEPDWVAPEDPEDPAAAESDDEADPIQPGEPDGEEGEPAAEAAEEAEAVAEDGDAAEDSAPKVQKPIDYSKKYFSYMAATEGQEFMCTTELRRPGPPPEDADEDFKPEPVPFTFRILDERMPMVYSPNVAFESSIKFFRDFPKIGAYQACGIQVPPNGEFKALIAADTLFPEGSGQDLSQEDQDFIWEVCLALGKAYEASERKFKDVQGGRSAKETIEALGKQITDIYFPPPPEPEEGEEGAQPTPAAAPPAPSEAPAEGEEAAAEDGEPAAPPEGEDADPVLVLQFEVNRLTKELAASSSAQESADKALNVAKQVLAAINGTLASISQDAVHALRNTTAVPQATFHVWKAVLHLLRKDPQTFANWERTFQHFAKSTFEELVNYDAEQERDPEVWKLVRSAYKAVSDPAKLATEMPATHLGVLLTMFIKQVRKVGRRAAAFRGHCKTTAELTEQLGTKTVELAEAEAKKAEAEEAARVAAEEEAARAAAEAEAAGAAGEGGEEGEEAAADE